MGNRTLVIGYGNPLRGDDAVGSATAAIVESWQLPGVKVVTLQQLLPELIDEIMQAERVLFVDAAIHAGEIAYACTIVEPKRSRRSFGHHDTPANLLALLHDLEGRTPETWLLTISAISFGHGGSMTAITTANMQSALAWIRNWLLLS